MKTVFGKSLQIIFIYLFFIYINMIFRHEPKAGQAGLRAVVIVVVIFGVYPLPWAVG
jgi:hypothetical protein